MDKGFKTILIAIVLCIILIVLKFTVFSNLFVTDELIPGVTDNPIFIHIQSNSTLGGYILSDTFTDDVAGVHIESKSEIYATNETTGKELFDKCYDSLIGLGLEQDYTKKYSREGKYTGVFKNETAKIVFHIFEGNDVEEYTGYYLILTVYKKSM